MKLLLSLCVVLKPPSEPNEPSVHDTGSSWAEISWVLPNNSSQQHYYIEYLDTVTQQKEESSRIFCDLFAPVSTYSTVLTDLRPATRYKFQVVAENTQGVKKGNVSNFTTTEASQYILIALCKVWSADIECVKSRLC